jgi:WD40 repeat protein
MDVLINSTIIVLFAHNFIQEYTLEKTLVNEKHSTAYLLYSGLLTGDKWEDLKIFAGTIFNGILYWNTTDDNRYYLKGHEGVIFNMDYVENVLVSCSDDRSIRVWNLATGEINGDLVLDCTSVELLGHLGRVWKCSIYKNYYVSISEDATVKVWNKQYELVSSFRGHGSKNVWSFDFDEEKLLILSGGGDGGIRLWDLGAESVVENVIHQGAVAKKPKTKKIKAVDEETNNEKEKDGSKVEKVIELITPSNPFNEEPKTFSFINKSTQIVLTSVGNFIEYSSTKEPNVIHTDRRFGSSPILKTSENTIFCTNTTGQLLIKPQNENAFVFDVSNEKICNFFVFGNNIFIFTKEDSDLIWLEFKGNNIIERNRFILPKHFFIMEISFLDEICLCIGSRKGAFAYYDLKLNSTEATLVHRHLHSTDAVTSITLQSHDNKLIIQSVGRDGMYVQSIIKSNKFTIQHSTRISKGWLEKIQNNLIFGFYQKKFLIFNLLTLNIEFSYSCGGGHRIWDLLIDDKIVFGFHKQKKIINVVKEITIGTVVLEAFNVLDTKACHHFYLDVDLVVTGSEDGILQFHTIDGFKRVGICKERLSSIKSIVSKDSFLFTGGAQEELIVWKLEYDGGLKCKRVAQIKKWGDGVENRVMSISVEKVDDIYYIISGNSDGSVRLYTFDTVEIKEIGCDFKHGRCVLKTDSIVLDGIVLFMTGCTGGKLIFWKLVDDNIVFIGVASVLQNGFKSLCSAMIDGVVNVFMGGDDNSVVLLQISGTFTSESLEYKCIRSEDAHISSVSGVYIGDKYLYSCSVDQTLNKYLVDNGELKKMEIINLDIKDIAMMDVKRKRNRDSLHFVCVGHGLQMFELEE